MSSAVISPVAVRTADPAATRAALLLTGAFVVVKLALHLWVGAGYGWFRDELYYVACSDHLAWGYVDQPPLSIALLKAWRLAFGDSLVAIRLLPALAGAATIAATGWMARALGGGLFAMTLAMTAALIAPGVLAVTFFYSMNAFDVLLWALAGAVLVKILTGDGGSAAADTRRWLAFGVIVGLGMLNKWSMMWFAGGVGLGLVATRERARLATRGPWLAALVAALLFLPHALWQIANGWPTLEFIHNATTGKMLPVTPLEFVAGQVRMMHPLTLPIWLAGLVHVLRRPRLRPLGIAFLAVAALLIANGRSRPNYLTPAYAVLFAAGGVALARTLLPARRPLVRGLALGVLLAGGAAVAPLALPLLPVDAYVAYAAKLGVAPSSGEHHRLGRLPQFFADMNGWDDFVADVARVYDALPPEDRARAAIFTNNYGEAGAIDVLGRRYGLPPASSGHNNYWLWGPHGSGQVLIVIGGRKENHLRVYSSAEPAGLTDCGDCLPGENHQTIWVLRGPRMSVAEVWPQLRHYE